MGSSNWVAKNPVYNAGSASPEGARGNSGNHGASCAGFPIDAIGPGQDGHERPIRPQCWV